MSDSLSIVITVIVLVLVIVLFPLYNVFERQDDMSYNIALKETTAFVDNVINQGYIDQEMFDAYSAGLAQTGNTYDVQLEVHKKLLTKNPDNPAADEYVEQYIIDYNSDIFAFNTAGKKVLKNAMYTLNVGDQIYVKLKNSSATLAGSLFGGIVPTNNDKTIAVNYGGIIKNSSWQQSNLSNLVLGNVYVDIKLIGNADNVIKYSSGYPIFYLDQYKDRTIKFRATITNLDSAVVSQVTSILQSKATLEGLTIGSVKPATVAQESATSWVITYVLEQGKEDFYLSGSLSKLAYAKIPGQVLQGTLSLNDDAVSPNILIHRNSTLAQGAYLYGPFTSSGIPISTVKEGMDIYFYANFIDPSNVVDVDSFKITFLKLIDPSIYGAYIVVTDETIPGSVDKVYKISMYDVRAVSGITLPVNNLQIRVDAGAYSSKTGTTSTLYSNTFTLSDAVESIFNYTGGMQTFIAPFDGTYMVKVYGAAGGGNPNKTDASHGGYGGFAQGQVTLKAGDKLYVYVGGKGVAATALTGTGGGYNGGGNGGKDPNGATGYGGGGATDVRTLSGNGVWNDANSLNSRIVVAGGGGGADNLQGSPGGDDDGSGGDGGGLSGQNALINGGIAYGTCGTQTFKAFGVGQSATVKTDAGGAGSGYYGGASTNNNNGGGGGGSSYVGGVQYPTTLTGINATNGYCVISLM